MPNTENFWNDLLIYLNSKEFRTKLYNAENMDIRNTEFSSRRMFDMSKKEINLAIDEAINLLIEDLWKHKASILRLWK